MKNVSHLWTKIQSYTVPAGTKQILINFNKHRLSNYWAKGLDCIIDLNTLDLKTIAVVLHKNISYQYLKIFER